MNMRKFIYGVVTLAVMLVIFGFSSQDGEASGQVSGIAAKIITSMGLGDMVPDIVGEEVENNVRKMAHIFLYFCLGTFSSLFFGECLGKEGFYRRIRAGMFSAVFCLFYAGLDEWHQTLVPGRSGRLSDVGIDARGFLAGILLTTALGFGINLIRGRKKEQSTGS